MYIFFQYTYVYKPKLISLFKKNVYKKYMNKAKEKYEKIDQLK